MKILEAESIKNPSRHGRALDNLFSVEATSNAERIRDSIMKG
jgi:hypothetical protein